MAKYQADGTVVRHVDGLEIVFWSDCSVYIKSNKSGAIQMTYCFHHWFWTQDHYHKNHWRYFVWALKYNQKLTLDKIFEIARRHEVTVQGGRMPDLTNKKIIVLPSEGRTRKKGQI